MRHDALCRRRGHIRHPPDWVLSTNFVTLATAWGIYGGRPAVGVVGVVIWDGVAISRGVNFRVVVGVDVYAPVSRSNKGGDEGDAGSDEPRQPRAPGGRGSRRRRGRRGRSPTPRRRPRRQTTCPRMVGSPPIRTWTATSDIAPPRRGARRSLLHRSPSPAKSPAKRMTRSELPSNHACRQEPSGSTTTSGSS